LGCCFALDPDLLIPDSRGSNFDRVGCNKDSSSFSIHFARRTAIVGSQRARCFSETRSHLPECKLVVPILLCRVHPFVRRNIDCNHDKNMKSHLGRLSQELEGVWRIQLSQLLGAFVLVQLIFRSETSAAAYILDTIMAAGRPVQRRLSFLDLRLFPILNLVICRKEQQEQPQVLVLIIQITAVLALQTVGGSAGNGICLNNIISACAVAELTVGMNLYFVTQSHLFKFPNTFLKAT